MKHKVVITGTGVVSPLGDARQSLHQALCDGKSGLRRVEGFSTPGIEHPLAGEITGFQAGDYLECRRVRPLNRTAQLLTAAAQLAIQDSGWEPERIAEHEVGLVVGTAFCSAHTISDFDIRAMKEGPSRASPLDFANTVINAAAGQAALWHKLTGPNSTIAAGSASGVESVGYACEMIRNGVAQVLLAGGVEELCYETLYAFYHAGLLCMSPGEARACPIPFDHRRNGFCLSEGAALLMLEEAESARARGANILGEIRGYASAFDCQTGADAGASGANGRDAMERAMRLALDNAGLQAADVNAVSASANGALRHDRAEARALDNLFQGRAEPLPITAIKSLTGESLGASGAMQAVAMVAAMHDGRSPGIAGLERAEDGLPAAAITNRTDGLVINNALLNAMGMDGNCCSLAIGC